MLCRILLWTCSRLFPIIDLRYVFTRIKAKIMLSLSAFVPCKSNRNLTIFPTSLKKLLFRDISCDILIILLKTIVSSSLSLNKLGNNFDCDTDLLVPIPSLLISYKKVLSYHWFATDDNFWCRQELKIWISDALFEQKRFPFDNLTHVVSWTKGELFYKNALKRSVLKSQFQNPRNLDEGNWCFHDSRKNNFKFTKEQKID